MANIRKGVPPGWTWREDRGGAPRWIPSPVLRKAGWKGGDLKDAHGAWLGRGGSIDAAKAINDAVAAWRAGETVAPEFANFAPAGADLAPRDLGGAADPLSIGALLDAYVGVKNTDGTWKVQPCEELRRRKPKTLSDRTNKLKRLIDVLAGYVVLPPADDAKAQAAYKVEIAKIRAASVFLLQPVEKNGKVQDLLHGVYWRLNDQAGVHMAYGVLTAASAWLSWAHKRRSRRIINWAAEVSRETPPGRIRVVTWPEIAALMRAADELQQPEIGDAIVLALDLHWSEADLLALTWARVVTDERGALRAMTGKEGRQKTGRVGGAPFLSMGKRRIETIRARQAAMDAKPLKVIVVRRKKRNRARAAGADADYFRKLFAEVRAHAEQYCASVASMTFADLRDTGFSLGRQAGLSDDMTASRTLQSRKNVANLGDKHYGEIGPEIADQAAALLDPYMEAQLKQYKVAL